jgi:hypothetical protein
MDTIGFFAMKWLEAVDSRSFHFALSLELTIFTLFPKKTVWQASQRVGFFIIVERSIPQ